MPRLGKLRGSIENMGQNGHDKWSSRLSSEKTGALTWADSDAAGLQAAVAAATEDGAALLLSKTSDGGALCIMVLNGTTKHKLYPASSVELSEALALIVEIAES